MKRKVFLRADGGTAIGLGHVVRSCALADMLKEDFECYFFIRNPSPAVSELILGSCLQVHSLPDDVSYSEEAAAWANSFSGNEIVVLDGYTFNEEYQQQIKLAGVKLVCIDDIHATHFVADAIINHAAGITAGNYATELYTSLSLGTDYVLLRAPFLDAVSQRKERIKLSSLFICLGGSDFNNLTGKMLEAAVISGSLKSISVVVGDAFRHIDQLKADIAKYIASGHIEINLYRNVPATEMAKILSASDLAICPCSSVLFEACAVGIGLISGFYVDNQQHIFRYLDQKGIFAGIGDFNTATVIAIAEKISSMNVRQVNQQIGIQKEFIDGDSPRRLRKLFHKLEKEYETAGRKVVASDVQVLFDWANDPETRVNAINTDLIPWEGHVQWFNRKIQDPGSHMFIFEQADTEKRIGLTRFDFLDGVYLISYLVGKEYRGAGWGEVILKSGIYLLMKAVGGRPKLRAMVKEGNVPSCQVFLNLGFVAEEPVVIDNIIYKVYEK